MLRHLERLLQNQLPRERHLSLVSRSDVKATTSENNFSHVVERSETCLMLDTLGSVSRVVWIRVSQWSCDLYDTYARNRDSTR